MSHTTCSTLYDHVYDDFVGRGYSAAEAAAAAQEAFSACLQRTSTITQATVAVPGGRQHDTGPTHPRSEHRLGGSNGSSSRNKSETRYNR